MCSCNNLIIINDYCTDRHLIFLECFFCLFQSKLHVSFFHISPIIKATTHDSATLWLLRSRPDQVPGDSMRGDPPSPIVYRKKQIFAKYPFSAVRSPLHERPLGATIGTLSGADSNPPPSSLARIRSAVLQVPLSRTQHLALSPAAFMPAPPCGPRSTVT